MNIRKKDILDKRAKLNISRIRKRLNLIRLIDFDSYNYVRGRKYICILQYLLLLRFRIVLQYTKKLSQTQNVLISHSLRSRACPEWSEGINYMTTLFFSQSDLYIGVSVTLLRT